MLEQAADRVVAVKPQSAFYERLGSPGIALLERVVRIAHDHKIPVLLDGKRGDIAAIAEAYADAYMLPDSPNPVDAITINPYMGADTMQPYIERSKQHGRGVFVVVKTSNPGSGDFQDLSTNQMPVYCKVAESLRDESFALRGPETGWSSLGVVTGITYPEQASRIRSILPHALFLLPGYGFQKGDLSKIGPAFVLGPKKREGGLISSSRATLFPHSGADSNFTGWKASFRDQLDEHILGVKNCL